MATFDAPAFLRSTLASIVGGRFVFKRIPFTFTSTARLIRGGKITGVGNKFAAQLAAERQKTQLSIIERETRGDAIVAQLGLSNVLNAARSIANQVVRTDMPVISMAVNPHSVKWTQNKRIVKTDTMAGSTYFHFSNSVDQNNDILQCTFAGKTGNINTQVGFLDTTFTGANLKLRVWHELYNLTREGMLLNEKNTGIPNITKGIPNQFFITYRTVLMPVQITLIGFFSSVLEFQESADSPNMVDYSMTFTVTDTYPSLDDISRLINTNLTVADAAKSVAASAFSFIPSR
jgi:hypothetical protein